MIRLFYSLILCSIFSLGARQAAAQCHIFDLVVEASDCDSNGHFTVVLDFEYSGVGNTFKVQGNGVVYGIFEYSSLPLTLGPLAGNGTTEYEFVVRDVAHPDCQDEFVLGTVDCGGSGDCAIHNYVLETGDCNTDGTYQLWIDFEVENSPNDFFDVFYAGQHLGFFAIANLPVLIEHFQDNGEPHPAVKVSINDTPNCFSIKEFTAPDCPASGDCHIFDMTAVASDCEAGMFFVTIDFEHENVGGAGFKVQGNGVMYGIFEYDDLPIQIGPFAGNGTTFYEFVVKDVNHPDCSDFVEFGTFECDQTGDCDINDLVVDLGDCLADGTYNVWLNFNVSNSITNFYKVKFQGETIAQGQHIANLPLKIEHFDDNGVTHPVLLVCMNDQPDCCAEIEFEAPECEPVGDCHIGEIQLEHTDCDSNGHYFVTLNFEHQNTGTEGFTIFGGGLTWGNFNYDDLPVTLGPLAGNGTIYEFVVKDLQHPTCKNFTHVGPIYCDDACHIFDLHAQTTDCDDQGQFYVELDFEQTGGGNEGFKVYGNGNVYGFFDYDDLPITLGPFESGNQVLEFGVSDVLHPDCHDFVEVNAPDCEGGGDCHIFDLVADVHPCLSDGTFYVSLEFQHNNTSNAGFRVQGNGVNYGLFGYDEVPVSIGPLVGNGTTPYEFAVSDLNHPDCGDALEVGPVECDLSGDCAIFDLIADPGACHDDGTYNLWLNFDFENAPNNFFDVIYNGQVIDYFPLANLPVVIPHFHDNGDTIQHITVAINDHPDCHATFEFEAPDCSNANIVFPGDADADNIATNYDLLNIGVAFGAEGAARQQQGIEWQGLAAEDWAQFFADDLNFKHADCNGNGKVNAADVEAILVNFSETHGEITAPVLLGGTENDAPFFVDLPEASAMQPGQQFFAPILLGSENKPVNDLYGIAFTLKFDPEIIDPQSIDLQYDPSWLGVKDVNLLTLDKTLADAGLVKAALVRTDQNNVSGFGQVAGFIGIIDNIAGKGAISIEIKDVKAIQKNEVLIPLHRLVEIVEFSTGTNSVWSQAFKVFPNPAGGTIYFRHPANLQVDAVEIKDVNGRVLSQAEVQGNSLNVSDLAAGIYFLKIKSGERYFQERIAKF